MLFKDANKCLDKVPKLIYDEACLDVVNNLTDSITVYSQYTDCHLCDFVNTTTVGPNSNTSILVNTRSTLQLYYVPETNNGSKFCPVEKLFYEHFRYGWNITNSKCSIYVKSPADNPYLPILMAFVVLFTFGTSWYMIKYIYKHSGRLRQWLTWQTDVEQDLSSSSGVPLVVQRIPSIKKHPNRLKSLDIFRGLCIIMMIFVNYGGGKYYFFQHSIWNGLTIADLVFPWFLWIMGMSLSVVLQKRLRRAVPRRQLVFSTIRRSLFLIFFGLLLNSNKNMQAISELRFPGVLQRIGITYFIVAIMEITFSKRMEGESTHFLSDLLVSWPQWLIVTFIIFIHTCVTFLAEVPGCGKGYLGPGGLDDGGKYYNCTGGIAGYIDRSIFGEHMYKTPPCHEMYETKVYYDPEGILGTFTSILSVYLGVQAGRILNTFQTVKAKTIRWVAWGLVTSVIGGALCGFSRDSGSIPINKQLWSLSYVLVTSGMAFVLFAFIFTLVDIFHKWGGRPFFYPGMNAIVIYLGHEMLRNTFPFAWKPTQQTHATFLFMNL